MNTENGIATVALVFAVLSAVAAIVSAIAAWKNSAAADRATKAAEASAAATQEAVRQARDANYIARTPTFTVETMSPTWGTQVPISIRPDQPLDALTVRVAVIFGDNHPGRTGVSEHLKLQLVPTMDMTQEQPGYFVAIGPIHPASACDLTYRDPGGHSTPEQLRVLFEVRATIGDETWTVWVDTGKFKTR